MMPLQLTALQLAPLLLGLLCSRATTAFQFFLKQGQGSRSASTSPPFTNSWRREEQPNNGRQSSDLFASTTSINIDQKQLLPGTAQLDTPWEELGFEFRPTRSHLRMVYRDGSWQAPELVSEPYIQLHIGATALHYGQACFEGLKAFCHSDNTVHLFRPDENAARMQSSCRRTLMPELPTDLFVEACKQVVKDNLDYVPPYGSNGALYIRPLLFGSGPRIGLQPADEYTFLCMVIPVGDYYKGGLSKPVHGRLITDYDRAAPRGVGNVKVAGNYAADLLPNMQSKKAGYPIGLYLDAATQSTVEEFSTSNFVGIKYSKSDDEPNVYVTPNSNSVLPSITNKALMDVARDQGLNIQERAIPLDELNDLDEVFAVGTAVVLTPVGSITHDSGPEPKVWEFGSDPDEIGPITLKLYEQVRAIQNGEREDIHGWNVQV